MPDADVRQPPEFCSLAILFLITVSEHLEILTRDPGPFDAAVVPPPRVSHRHLNQPSFQSRALATPMFYFPDSLSTVGKYSINQTTPTVMK